MQNNTTRQDKFLAYDLEIVSDALKKKGSWPEEKKLAAALHVDKVIGILLARSQKPEARSQKPEARSQIIMLNSFITI